MKRLKLDQIRLRGTQRAQQYTRIERESGPHPATQGLQQRPVEIAQDSRMERYAKIDRSQA